MPASPRRSHWAAVLMLCASSWAAAQDGTHFDLALQGQRLELVARGERRVYWPTVRRLLADGRWEPLTPVPPVPGAQLAPDEAAGFAWPSGAGLVNVQALRVDYREADGMAFTQMAWLPPLQTQALLRLRREGTHVLLDPPGPDAATLRRTWILWGTQEDSTALIRPMIPDRTPDPARLIDWPAAPQGARFELAAGTEAWLLHETTAGWRVQAVPADPAGKRHPIAGWLQQPRLLLALGASAIIAAGLLAWRGRAGRR